MRFSFNYTWEKISYHLFFIILTFIVFNLIGCASVEHKPLVIDDTINFQTRLWR